MLDQAQNPGIRRPVFFWNFLKSFRCLYGTEEAKHPGCAENSQYGRLRLFCNIPGLRAELSASQLHIESRFSTARMKTAFRIAPEGGTADLGQRFPVSALEISWFFS
jgi:hypothetical protein